VFDAGHYMSRVESLLTVQAFGMVITALDHIIYDVSGYWVCNVFARVWQHVCFCG